MSGTKPSCETGMPFSARNSTKLFFRDVKSEKCHNKCHNTCITLLVAQPANYYNYYYYHYITIIMNIITTLPVSLV